MSQLLMHQPFKTLYLFMTTLALLILLPFWTLVALVPQWRPRRSWTIARTLMIWTLQFFLPIAFRTYSFAATFQDPKVLEKDPKNGVVWVKPDEQLVIGEIKEFAQKQGVRAVKVAGYWYGRRDASGQVGTRAASGERVIYEFHGGGFIVGNGSPKGPSAKQCTDMLHYFKHSGFARAFQIEYRKSQAVPLPPHHPFPAALIDAIMGYKYLVWDLGFAPENILLTGESAGATLALQLIRFLRGHPSLPVPGALLVLSPSVDWGLTHAGPGSSFERNADTDYIQPFLFTGTAIRSLLGALPISEAYTNPWFSPASLRLSADKVSGLFRGFPPTCIQVGDSEFHADEAKTLYERLVGGIGQENAVFVEIPDATHMITTYPGHQKELEVTYARLVPWVEKVFHGDSSMYNAPE